MGASQFQPVVSYDLQATFTGSSTTSTMVDLRGNVLRGVFLPSGFTGTTLRLQAATDSDETYLDVEDGSGSNVTLTASGASKFVPLPTAHRDAVDGLRFVKMISGSTQTTTNIVTLAVRPI